MNSIVLKHQPTLSGKGHSESLFNVGISLHLLCSANINNMDPSCLGHHVLQSSGFLDGYFM